MRRRSVIVTVRSSDPSIDARVWAELKYDRDTDTIMVLDPDTNELVTIGAVPDSVSDLAARWRLLQYPIGTSSGLAQVNGSQLIVGELPANSVVQDVYLRVDHAETSTPGASLFCGLDPNGLNGDAQSFFAGNGVSVATTGVRATRLDDGGNPTRGGAMKQSPQDSNGDVEKVPGQYLTDSGTRSIVVSGNGNFTDFDGVLFFVVLDLSADAGS